MVIKQVICLREDLVLSRGKIAAQVAHASLGVFADRILVIKDETDHDDNEAMPHSSITLRLNARANMLKEWFDGIFTKIVVSVKDEDELLSIYNRTVKARLLRSLITDSAKTELKEPTLTCCAIGPDYDDRIDQITGHLKLFK